ncbi:MULTISPECIES: 16S rRNA (guanine(527)-N(7))-methyltransferase RsmG [Psychrobacter]|jgi:16S rRNA (guanine527-N7)-methyltransferase|uniref:Ribosomal RNA small subunit methyltransferase G n=2 Tax=Psychrobacter TaxID=497 RepID=RSMG_PSYWF|nr:MULTISPECIES: 16S rRNA (guanine(527)-N(7))-methyltransferase RsmG [unclassified Psychrobacter]A5WFA2.1 RecName: Full=Ribosomal RNA small subunit methyltransferase G; AltName: Full=16S rRNA 7-methylguanosine methyltransferase; Short=16S rRNA m7G methyltransferase [Psychrobacter sp. PRwf-1]UNK04478.1 16S rRNA (guanine(527)-N(7))-methyltransferase RsmG [Psychrobacter sp. PraFG1]
MMNTAEFKVIFNQYDELDTLLLEAITQLKIDISAEQRRKLLLYLDKLLFWNKAYNLTAIKQPKEALIKHVIDCLAILPHLKPGKLLDIGTGAGLPGVIVAICEPERPITVLDSNQKKIRFIRQSISELQVTNVTPVASRIENFNPDEGDKFAVVTSRAFASLTDFVEAAAPRLAQGGWLQAMKGLIPEPQELQVLQDQWQIDNIALSVPYLHETRHLTELHKIVI